MRRNLKIRRGVTAVLAMMYLVLFSTLALGFFATMTSSAQLSGNDQRSTEARLAAESGMQFMKYHLWGMRIPKTTHRAQILAATYAELSSRLDGTPNMKGQTVGVSGDGTKIYVPGPENAYISVDGAAMEFRATIEKYGEWGLRVTTVGRSNPSFTTSTNVRGGRGIELQFENKPEETSIFGYGMAARGTVTMDGNARVNGSATDVNLGNMLIASTLNPTLTMKSNTAISGTVAFTDPTPTYSTDAGTRINNVTPLNVLAYPSKMSTVPSPPEFPAVDTEPFQRFAGAAAGYGGTTVNPPNSAGETKFSSVASRNVLIKASPHADRWVTFDSGTIDGVVYIETPNKVRFTGNVVIRGAIVVQNDPTHDHTRNKLEFLSNPTLRPIELLAPLNSPNFPPAMTELIGASILAPGFEVRMDANFGSQGGSIIADKLIFDSNATGSIRGSVISLQDTPVMMNGNATINVVSRTAGDPLGVRFTSYFKPLPNTYKEVKP